MNNNYLRGKLHWLLVAVVAAALLAAGYSAWQRHLQEQDNKAVELAVVYNQIDAMARAAGLSTVEALEMFRLSGATAVLIKEPDLPEAEKTGEFVVFRGAVFLLNMQGRDLGPLAVEIGKVVNPGDTVLVTRQEESFRRVVYQLGAKGIPLQTVEDNDFYLLSTSYPYSWLVEKGIGLGFPAQYLADIKAAGLRTMVQLRTWPAPTREGVEKVFAPLREISDPGPLLFNDARLPGPVAELAEEIRKLDVPLAQVEFFDQQGLNGLGYLLDKKVVRLHSIPQKEAGNYTPRTAADRFLLAATERNMRVLLIHDLALPYGDPVEYNLALVERVRDGLLRDGLQVGSPSLFEPMAVSRPLLYIMGLGVIAGGMLLLEALRLRRLVIPLGLLALLAWTGLLGAGMVDAGRKLMALGAVIVFPTLAVLQNVGERGVSPVRAVLLLLRMSALSLAGALLTVGLLAGVDYMLKLDQFAGVKIAHVLPLLILGLFYFFYAGSGGNWAERLRKVADQPLTVKLALVGAVLAAVGLIYLLRTGNDAGVAVSSLELKVRALLDNLLQVRPRTKEFALGHPLMLLLLYLGYRDYRFLPLLLGGVIGQISLVNTYAHIHTPLAVSLLRSFNGLWLGIVGGLVLILLWRLGERLAEKYRI